MSVHISGLSTEDTELIIAALRSTGHTSSHSVSSEGRRRCLSLADRIAGGLEQQQRRGSARVVRLEVAS